MRRIWLYVAEHNLEAADRLIDRFKRAMQTLARHPLMSEAMPQYRPGLRRFTIGTCVLYYEPIQGGVRLVRVLHGARDVEDLFQ